MVLPAPGKVHVDLQGAKSDQIPNIAWIDGVTIPSGGTEIDINTFAPFGHTVKFTATATLAQSPTNDGIGFVTVKKGSLPNTIKVECWQATVVAGVVTYANTVTGLVNIIAIIGTSVSA